MALENFTTYTEVDPGSDITVAANTITWTNLAGRNDTAYVYKDMGAAHFSGDFTHKLTVNISAANNFAWAAPWGLSNAISDIKGVIDASGDAQYIVTYQNGSGQFLIVLEIRENGAAVQDASVVLSKGTAYYVTVTRDDDAGTSGTGLLTVEIHTGDYHPGGAHVDTLTVNCSAGEQNDFRYLYATITQDDNHASTPLISGTVNNLDIGEAATWKELSGSVSAASSFTANANRTQAVSAPVLAQTTITAGLYETIRRLSGSVTAVSSLSAQAALTHAVSAPLVFDYTEDPNCVALWRLENGALTVDSVGTNTLVDNGWMGGSDTVNFKEGAASGIWTNNSLLSCTDALLSSDFPFKSGTANKTISVCCWFRPTSPSASNEVLVAKNNTVGGEGEWCFVLRYTSAKVELVIGYGTGYAEAEFLALPLPVQANVWYHVGATYRDSDGAYHIRAYNSVTDVVYDVTGNTTHGIRLTTEPWMLGQQGGVSWQQYGRMDEVIIFSRVLSSYEIDAIRGQTGALLLSGGIFGTSSVTGSANMGFNISGAVNALSSLTASAGITHSIAGAILAQSLLTALLQIKLGSYAPGAILAEPYPVPMLWDYLRPGMTFEQGVTAWAQEVSKWCEEHMVRAYRELSRIGQEKAADWVDA